MKPSFYNFYKISDGMVLIYNSASGSCIAIAEAELSAFMEVSLPQNDVEKMKKFGFYVDDESDEMDHLICRAYNNLENSKKDKYRILTTTACNAKCPYCYEKGVKSYTMTMETADRIVDFILEKSNGKKVIEIEWFGGEPLLNKNIIAYVSDRIDKLKPVNMKYEAAIITNGYLLDKMTVDKLVNEWFVKRIQITLDGMGETYENIKQLGEGSFEKVIENIRMLCSYDIEVDIPLNFDENNLHDMQRLIDYLSTLDFKEKLYIYPAKINDELRNDNFALENESIKMYNMLFSSGLIHAKDLLPKTMKNPCAASKKDYFTINATGELFKCDRKLLAGNSVGSVYMQHYDDIKDTSEWELINPEEKCKKCRMFPLCWGGCIYERIKKMDRCYITEKIIDNNLELILSDLLKREQYE